MKKGTKVFIIGAVALALIVGTGLLFQYTESDEIVEYPPVIPWVGPNFTPNEWVNPVVPINIPYDTSTATGHMNHVSGVSYSGGEETLFFLCSNMSEGAVAFRTTDFSEDRINYFEEDEYTGLCVNTYV